MKPMQMKLKSAAAAGVLLFSQNITESLEKPKNDKKNYSLAGFSMPKCLKW